MATIRFGCQTYSWLMSGDANRDRLDHIMRVAAQAGFAGLESEVVMLGRLADPAVMQANLDANRTILGAVCLVQDWRGPGETPAERAEADRIIALLGRFPGTVLSLCQMPGADRVDLRARQTNLLTCANAIAKRAADRGIRCTYHPNSPGGSVYRTAEDYEILLAGLDQKVLGYAPDVGHIAAGGMDPLAIIKRYRSQVNHVHFKDMFPDRRWAHMGGGVIDFAGIVAYLRDTGYDGWIMVEDECEQAERDPDGATANNGVFVREKLVPIAQAATAKG